MRGACPYCEWQGKSQGLKGHVKMAHPDHYARWQFTQIDSPTTGKIRKEYLKPESTLETNWYNRYSLRSRDDDAKNLVLVDGNREPVPDASHPKELREVEPPKPVEKKYQCGNCENMFDDPIWSEGEAYCPICEEQLNSEELDG